MFDNNLIRCRVAERQPRERELLGGSVPIDHLPGYVQEDVAPFLIHIFQGTARHEEEVLRGQTERVCGRSGDDRTGLLKMDRCGKSTMTSISHTVNMNHIPIVQDTAGTVFPIVPNLRQENGGNCCFIIRWDDHNSVRRWLEILCNFASFLACTKQRGCEQCQCQYFFHCVLILVLICYFFDGKNTIKHQSFLCPTPKICSLCSKI